MRVLFWYRGIESLGLGYLMSMLTSHGHEIDLIFEPGLDDNTVMNVPALARLNRPEALVERAKAFQPDLVCIGAPTNLWSHASRMGERLKRELDVPVVVGGHHAQALPEYVINHWWVDVVCIGEGELSLLELVARMSRGEDYTDVPTMWVKQDGVVHRNEIGMLENDLDLLPFPEKRLWWEAGAFRDVLEVFTGRGCPFKCTFCNIHYQREIFDGKGDFLRKRSVANVMEELQQNLRTYDPSFVSLHDDNFTTNVLWVEEFCEVYRDQIGLPWYCFGYPTTIKPRLMKAMAAANCSMLFMGVDSGDADVRATLMERPMTDELIYEKARLIHEHGIRSFVSTIYGIPGETPETMWKTLDMVDTIKPSQASGNVFYPLPKTKLYDLSVEMGYLDEEGEEKVRRGESSFHQHSILNHPHKELAEALAKITPLYVKAPSWAKPLLRTIVERRMTRTAQALYIVMIPVSFSQIGKEAVRITLASLKAVFLGKGAGPRRRRRRSGPQGSPTPRRPAGTTWTRPEVVAERKERIPESVRSAAPRHTDPVEPTPVTLSSAPSTSPSSLNS
ncbi:MAG: B12-binding domain-containing radical SAM protein [Actinomycetes bacterium]